MKNEDIRYQPYAGYMKTIRIGGKRVQQSICDTWIDVDTGEILTSAEFKAYKVPVPAQHRYGLRVLEQEAALSVFRKEVREFALYLLTKRDYAGGFIRPMHELIADYAAKEGVEGKALSNRKEKLKKMVPILEDGGFLLNEYKLRPLFMRIGKLDKVKAAYGTNKPLSVRPKAGWSIDDYIDTEKLSGWMPDGSFVTTEADTEYVYPGLSNEELDKSAYGIDWREALL